MKKLVIALMAFALVISLAGCGGGGGSSSEEHWGDKGANLPAEIKDTTIPTMSKAFAPATVTKMHSLSSSERQQYIKENFTNFIKEGVYFMDNKNYTRDKMTTRMDSVVNSYNFNEYSMSAGETKKVNDSKYTSWVYCVLDASRISDKEKRSQTGWMQFTWEKGSDGKWYITSGFNNSKWFE